MMCELLAISSEKPTAVSVSLEQFASHGSEQSDNKDGWGIVYYSDNDIRRFRDTGPASASKWVRFVEQQSLRSTTFIAHIRHANTGKISLSNTHPFARELGGTMHSFAHNGFLQSYSQINGFEPSRFKPIGQTDSEWAFCVLLDRLADIWMTGECIPDLADRFTIIETFCAQMRELGPANFIYSDGDTVFAHADRRLQGDGEIREPGLWISRQRCPGGEETICGGGLDISSPIQSIVLVASVPLTSTGWIPLQTGTLVAKQSGEIRHSNSVLEL